jgi:hypothetical protein
LDVTFLFRSGRYRNCNAAKLDLLGRSGAGFAFLYYFERNTTSTLLTKVAMPMLATAGGLLPHIIRRIRLLFTFCSLVAGIAGLVVLSLVSNTLLSSASSFASKGIAIIMVAFGTASLAAGALSVADVRRDILRES